MDVFILLAIALFKLASCSDSNNFNSSVDEVQTAIEKMSVKDDDSVSEGEGYISELLDEFFDELKSDIQTLIMRKLRTKPKDCDDVLSVNNLGTGVYTIYPSQFPVRCDIDDSSGSIVIQRRISKSNFYKNWYDYESGFGDLNTNFWLGLSQIHAITSQDNYALRVELVTFDGQTAYAEYRHFFVSDAKSGYRLFVDGYKGTAGDSFTTRGNGMKFSTYDRDNDISSANCAVLYHGGWWYDKCHTSNLNGDYGNMAYAKGPVWEPWKGYYEPMKATEMKIRRTW